MLGVMPLLREPPRDGGRQLRIHQEAHPQATRTIVWSTCRAAYSRAAVMSASSR
jgi:hypothetical protein